MIAMAPVQQKNKKYDLKIKLSVVKYAEENSGEAATRRFSVDPKRVRDSASVRGGQQKGGRSLARSLR